MKNKKGFTIVETLVAIGILVAAVTGASTAAQSGISLATFSKDQLVAFHLAQEGIEQVRNMRGVNNLNERNWLFGISAQASDPCYFGKVCRADVLDNSLTVCSGGAGTCPLVKQDVETGFYGYESDWTDTQFRREITLTQIDSKEVSILVKVTWNKGASNREFRARENILNW